MKKDILFTVSSYFRDDMNIMAYRFGKGEKTCAVIGALRGDEVQQLYVCARLVSFLREVEKEDGVQPGKSVMIVPTVIGASMNEGSRLWEPENMDINRRFPGDVTGSTTERIAGALLDRLKNYRYGVQLTSFYQPGSFVPHVRMMDTGRQNPDLGCEFGLPYVYPGPSQPGLAVTDSGGPVALRAYPSAQGQVITQIPNGTTVTVFGQYQGWYVVLYGESIGYANAAFIQL